MRAYREKPRANPVADAERTVEFLTELGFIIVRRCDLDGSDPATATEHCFVVRDMDGCELDITVSFDAQAAHEVITRGRGRVKLYSSFWIAAAERHLAEYLDMNGDFPPRGKLTIAKPNLDDIDSALRWSADQNPDNNG